ncbi:MAG: hypothetical protein ACI4L6_03665 [Candidatus Onthoplasma sp.]
MLIFTNQTKDKRGLKMKYSKPDKKKRTASKAIVEEMFQKEENRKAKEKYLEEKRQIESLPKNMQILQMNQILQQISMNVDKIEKEIENLNNKIATRQKKMAKLNPATLGYTQMNQEKEIFENALSDKEIELIDGMERTLDSLCKDIPSFIDNLTEDINIETLFNRFNKLVKKYENKTNQYTDFAENLYDSLEKMNSKYSCLVDLSSSELKV